MRKFIFGLGVLLLSAVSTHAQSGDTPNYDFAKPMYTVVDVATKGYFGGWSGDCNSGRIPSAITLWRIEPGPALRTHLQLADGAPVYGRSAQILVDERPNVQLLEIVRLPD